MQWTAGALDTFVARSDELGGPTTSECQKFWEGFSYVTAHKIDETLDPFSDAYVEEQMLVYEEIAGHTYYDAANELCDFILEEHVAAPNPYNHPNPTTLAMHIQRLARALKLADPQRGQTLLDLGCGWGLSSELAAYLGLKVTAIDINSQFVTLVNERTKRTQHQIVAFKSSFEEYEADEKFDLALFYECLHHAVRPWAIIGKIAKALNPGGRLVLVGEPINDLWWKHWGIRLDPLSIYCVRKFGWFESGWSLKFILQALRRAGLTATTHYDSDEDVGCIIIAQKDPSKVISGSQFADLASSSGCSVDEPYLILAGRGEIHFAVPYEVAQIKLNAINFRPTPLHVEFSSDTGVVLSKAMPQGPNEIVLAGAGLAGRIAFQIETWVPSQETGTADRRTLGLHLGSVEFIGL